MRGSSLLLQAGPVTANNAIKVYHRFANHLHDPFNLCLAATIPLCPSVLYQQHVWHPELQYRQ